MRPSLLRMISPSSLSAFSASATRGVVQASTVAPSGSGIPPLSPLRPAPPPSPPPQGGAGGAPAPRDLAPGQRLPRGSLLNLSV